MNEARPAVREELVERLAAGMYTAADKRTGTHLPWRDYIEQSPGSAKDWRFLARACLAAIEAEGMVIVPREPTEMMGWAALGTGHIPDAAPAGAFLEIWSAALAAAPKQG